ncbi:hypothetical protein TNCV_2471121 [Trichonephila clavipes]|nr:hypothetical protein TNCV_2471121 [Trichonephila clavipes]
MDVLCLVDVASRDGGIQLETYHQVCEAEKVSNSTKQHFSRQDWNGRLSRYVHNSSRHSESNRHIVSKNMEVELLLSQTPSVIRITLIDILF